jgi:hypothetical protein
VVAATINYQSALKTAAADEKEKKYSQEEKDLMQNGLRKENKDVAMAIVGRILGMAMRDAL